MAAKRDKNDLVGKPKPDASGKELARLHIHFLETTWRVAVPILLLSIGGNKLDERYDTLPIFSLAGLFLSLVFSTILIYRYLKKNFPEAFRRDG